MKNFKKGAFSKGGGGDFAGRPKFGGDRKFNNDRGGEQGGGRDRGGERGGFGAGRPELFAATCSACGKGCELPFRPSGDRPVFCRDCFDKKDDSRSHSSFQRTERPREFRPSPREGSNNSGNDEIKKQLANLEYKMDKIMKMISGGEAHKTVGASAEQLKIVSTPQVKVTTTKNKPEPVLKKATAKKVKSVAAKKAVKKK